MREIFGDKVVPELSLLEEELAEPNGPDRTDRQCEEPGSGWEANETLENPTFVTLTGEP